MTERHAFEVYPDLAARLLGGSVVAANDETFAEKENLIKAADPVFAASTFGNKGQVMDGWETRRRREPGHDWAIVRLGVAGVINGIVVDTAFFTGNYPPEASIDAACLDTLVVPDPAELGGAEWIQIVPRSPLKGHNRQMFEVTNETRFTHVRLNVFPDGGVARLRVHGEPIGDPRWVAGVTFDLAAIELGARVTDASNRFYAAPDNVLMPGPARVMGEGWETARRRDDGNDWFEVALATEGIVRRLEVDTSCFIGNAPGWARVTGRSGAGAWTELLAKTPMRKDTVHRYLRPGSVAVDTIRVDIYPDGGLARFRAYGIPTPQGRARLFARWFDSLTESAAVEQLSGYAGASRNWATALAAHRPLVDPDGVAAALSQVGPGGPATGSLGDLMGVQPATA